MASPYEILGIDPDADEATVRAAYRDRVKEVHPDQGGSASEFQRVRSAYLQIRRGEATPEDDVPAPAEEAAAPDPSPGEEAVGQPGAHVEYLNYDALDDHGWALTDDDLFAKAADADLGPLDHGEFVVDDNQSLLEAAEDAGYPWPFACRGGACSNCAVAVIEGEVPPPVNHVLTPELLDRGIRLSCVSAPVTEDTKVVYNVKHLPGVEELLLPPSRFEQAYSSH